MLSLKEYANAYVYEAAKIVGNKTHAAFYIGMCRREVRYISNNHSHYRDIKIDEIIDINIVKQYYVTKVLMMTNGHREKAMIVLDVCEKTLLKYGAKYFESDIDIKHVNKFLSRDFRKLVARHDV